MAFNDLPADGPNPTPFHLFIFLRRLNLLELSKTRERIMFFNPFATIFDTDRTYLFYRLIQTCDWWPHLLWWILSALLNRLFSTWVSRSLSKDTSGTPSSNATFKYNPCYGQHLFALRRRLWWWHWYGGSWNSSALAGFHFGQGLKCRRSTVSDGPHCSCPTQDFHLLTVDFTGHFTEPPDQWLP